MNDTNQLMDNIPTDHLKKLWNQICVADDLKSFELLFHQLNRNLVLFCDTFIHNEYASEELVSDVFVHLWNNRSTLDRIDNPKSYLYTAVKNKALNHLKKFSHLQLHVDLSDELKLVDGTDPNIMLERKEFFLRVDSIVAKLPAQTLLVFRLIKEDGMKYKEVAQLLNISPRTVQTHMRRALQKISLLLGAYMKKDKSLLSNKLYSIVILLLPFL